MVNMEVWIPTHLDTMSLQNSLDVKECGSIAPPGHFGWFIPVALSRPGDSWIIFTKRETAARFDVDEFTLDNIRNFTINPATKADYCQQSFCQDGLYIPEWCQGKPCALLLTSYGNITDFVKDHIDQLKLYVKVAWVGPNLKYVTKTLTKELLLIRNSTHDRYLFGTFLSMNERCDWSQSELLFLRRCSVAQKSWTIEQKRFVFTNDWKVLDIIFNLTLP